MKTPTTHPRGAASQLRQVVTGLRRRVQALYCVSTWAAVALLAPVALGGCGAQSDELGRRAERPEPANNEPEMVMPRAVDLTGLGAVTAQEFNLPNGVDLEDVMLLGRLYLQTSQKANITSGAVVSMGTKGVRLGWYNEASDIYSNGDVVLQNGSTVRGTTRSSASIVEEEGASVANPEPNTPLEPFEIVKYLAVEPAGGDAGVVTEGVTRLLPGSYGDYAVSGGTLELISGAYTFGRFDLGAGAELRLDQEVGPIVVYLGFPGKWEGAVKVQGGGDPDLLFIYAGREPWYLSAPANMFVLLTNARLNFQHPGPHAGTFYGTEMLVNKADAEFRHRSLRLEHFFGDALSATRVSTP